MGREASWRALPGHGSSPDPCPVHVQALYVDSTSSLRSPPPPVNAIISITLFCFFLMIPLPVLFIHLFTPDISKAPLKATNTQRRSRHSTDTVSEFHAEAQLRMKDLPRVPTWRLEQDSNLRPLVAPLFSLILPLSVGIHFFFDISLASM